LSIRLTTTPCCMPEIPAPCPGAPTCISQAGPHPASSKWTPNNHPSKQGNHCQGHDCTNPASPKMHTSVRTLSPRARQPAPDKANMYQPNAPTLDAFIASRLPHPHVTHELHCTCSIKSIHAQVAIHHTTRKYTGTWNTGYCTSTC
jgi:hypothetical protein